MKKRVVIVKICNDGTTLTLFRDFADIKQAEEAARFLNSCDGATWNGLYYVVEVDDD